MALFLNPTKGHTTLQDWQFQQNGWNFRPLTTANRDDFETLFGARGACGGCWCMYWRLKRADYEAQKGAGNHQAMKTLLEEGGCPGIIAYRAAEPAGWCAVAPREEYPTLARARILKPVDDLTVWAITCFFVAKAHRRKGLTTALISAAANFAAHQGATVLEAYPVDPKKDNYPPVFAFTGLFSAFLQNGFQEVARRSETRPIVRKYLT